MRIIINFNSMVPIYEQISDQIKRLIKEQILKENDPLPSVRSLAKELKISALTVKKAYDELEGEGIVNTIHGKGTYIAACDQSLILEEENKVIEEMLRQAIFKAKRIGINDDDLCKLFKLLLENDYA